MLLMSKSVTAYQRQKPLSAVCVLSEQTNGFLKGEWLKIFCTLSDKFVHCISRKADNWVQKLSNVLMNITKKVCRSDLSLDSYFKCNS